MHLQQGLSTINTRKTRKLPKMTKAKMTELETDWRKHNKHCKRNHMHHFRYDTLEAYIEYRFGLKKKLDPRDRSLFKPRQVETNWRAEQDADHRVKYPSLMEQCSTCNERHRPSKRHSKNEERIMGHPTNTQIKKAIDEGVERILKELKTIQKNGMPAGIHIESGWADEERKQKEQS